MERFIEVSKFPNFEVTSSNGKKYVLLPFERLYDIPAADVVPRDEIDKIFDDIEKILFHREITSDLNFDAYYGAKTAVERIAAKIDELKKNHTDVTDICVGHKTKEV